MALEDGGTRFPSMVLVIPIRRLAGVPGLNPSIAIEAFEPSKMGKNFSPKLGNLGLADFVFRHGRRHPRDLNVEFGLLAFGLLTLARGLEHVNSGLATTARLSQSDGLDSILLPIPG